MRWRATPAKKQARPGAGPGGPGGPGGSGGGGGGGDGGDGGDRLKLEDFLQYTMDGNHKFGTLASFCREMMRQVALGRKGDTSLQAHHANTWLMKRLSVCKVYGCYMRSVFLRDASIQAH